jgi:hypothetical protein
LIAREFFAFYFFEDLPLKYSIIIRKAWGLAIGYLAESENSG